MWISLKPPKRHVGKTEQDSSDYVLRWLSLDVQASGAMQLEPVAGKRKISLMDTAEEDHGQRL